MNGVSQETYQFDSQGRLSAKAGQSYAYTDTLHAHAATSLDSNQYRYDANGNMTTRNVPEGNFALTKPALLVDASNRLVGVSGAA